MSSHTKRPQSFIQQYIRHTKDAPRHVSLSQTDDGATIAVDSFGKMTTDESTTTATTTTAIPSTSSRPLPSVGPLSQEQIDTYIRDGVLVVDGIFDEETIRQAKCGLKETLWELAEVDTDNLESTGYNLTKLSTTNGSGGVLDVFYPLWKIRVATDPTLLHATQQLWRASWCCEGETKEDLMTTVTNVDDEKERTINMEKSAATEGFFRWHPYGPFDCEKGYIYVDRICYRVPTDLAAKLGEAQSGTCDDTGTGIRSTNDGTTMVDDQQAQPSKNAATKKKKNKKKNKKKQTTRPIQRSLTPHLDCCPDKLFGNELKWRPIQCFVSLTSNTESNTGGFEAAKGFHREFDAWAKTRSPSSITKRVPPKGIRTKLTFPAPCVGAYTHIRPKEDADVMERVQHVPVKAGSVVFWDNRIPHANAYRHDGDEARSVVYCSFLPDVPLNRKYARRQLQKLQRGIHPNDQWINEEGEESDENEKMTSDDDTNRSQLTRKSHGDILIGSLSPLGRKLFGVDNWE